MGRKKVYKKSFEICDGCEWLERKVNFEFRCNKPIAVYMYGHVKTLGNKFVSKEKFLKKVPDEHCDKIVEHQIFVLNKENE